MIERHVLSYSIILPLLSTAVIDFLPINQARLKFYRFCPFQGILRTVYKVTVVLI